MLIFRRFRNQTNKSEHIRTESSETIRTYPNKKDKTKKAASSDTAFCNNIFFILFLNL